MFEWLNKTLTPKLLPFTQKFGRDKAIKWGLIFCGVVLASSISKGGYISSILLILAITYLSSKTSIGEGLSELLKKKGLMSKADNSEYWLATILIYFALVLSPTNPSISKEEGLTIPDKREVTDNSSNAKQHCLTYVKFSLDDLDYDISFPHAHRQLKNQTYVINMKGKVENMFGGKTRKEWDCQIKYIGSGNASEFENWDLQIIEDRDI
jgi:hypothetical protein